MRAKILAQLCFSFIILFNTVAFANELKERAFWIPSDTNTAISSSPTTLKYFKFYDSLPDKITLPIFKDKDLSALAGKKVYVGYGLIDPKGNNCRTFPGNMTASGQDETICLPWWRIEREYKIKSGLGSDSLTSFLDNLPMQYPPKAVSVCKQYETLEMAQGGKVTCTSYYDRLKSKECYDKPEQGICLKDNCSNNIKTTCTLKGVMEGEVTSLITAFSPNNAAPIPGDGKTKLLTYQYECPDGYLPKQKCLTQINALMYPFECRAPTSNASKDGEYLYCPKENPIYDAGGNLKGFSGQCSDGRNVTCQINTFNQKTRTCLEPLKEAYSTYSTFKQEFYRNTYTDYTVDLVNGQIDTLAANPMCLRLHTEEPLMTYNPDESGSSMPYTAHYIKTHEGGNCGGIEYDMTCNDSSCTVNHSGCTGSGCGGARWSETIDLDTRVEYMKEGNAIYLREECDFDKQAGGGGCGVDRDTGEAKFFNWLANNGTTVISSTTPLPNGSWRMTGQNGAWCEVNNIHRQCREGYTYNPTTFMCDRNYETHVYRCYNDFLPENLPQGCQKTSDVLAQPVTDITNKTLFTKKTVFAICSQTGERTIGCKKYDESSVDGNISLNLDVAYETKDYNKLFGQAIATAQSQEQMLHVFSGWNGECEHGMFTDFSWLNDPMFWASTAMSVYSAASQGELGNQFAKSLNSYTAELGTLAGGTGTELGTQLVSSAGNNAQVAEGIMTSWEAAAASPVMSSLSFASALAPLAAPPSQQEQVQAITNQKAWMGASTTDMAANAYKSCMASLGLNYANVISYQAGADDTILPAELMAPWNNPIRISHNDFQGLQAILTKPDGDQNYLANNYKVVSQDAIGITLIARDMSSYMHLGNVLCAGYRVAGTMNQANAAALIANIKNNGNSNDTATSAAVNAVLAGIGTATPGGGVAATVVYKTLTSFSFGNACEDEKFAMSKGKLQYKTYKFNKFEQCHYNKEECSKKFGFGPFQKCITHKKEYCCYDQIITRIFAESVQEEIGPQWGSKKCSEMFSIYDLKRVGFRACRPGEAPAANKCMSPEKYAELKQYLQRQIARGLPIDSIEGQIKNAISLPK